MLTALFRDNMLIYTFLFLLQRVQMAVLTLITDFLQFYKERYLSPHISIDYGKNNKKLQRVLPAPNSLYSVIISDLTMQNESESLFQQFRICVISLLVHCFYTLYQPLFPHPLPGQCVFVTRTFFLPSPIILSHFLCSPHFPSTAFSLRVIQFLVFIFIFLPTVKEKTMKTYTIFLTFGIFQCQT